jgi:hypothetical protein
MRKGFLGSVAALAAGAGAAWGQPSVDPAPPAGLPIVAPGAPGAPSAPVGPPPPISAPVFGGLPSHAIPGNAGFPPPPSIMPPGNFGPPSDPLGLGPVGGFGPPPGPMYPMPGPYGAQSYQPPPPMPNVGGGLGGGDRGLGYGAAPHWWFDGEYLLWFTKGQPINFPLVTASAPADAGVLTAGSTLVLSGQRDLGYNAMNGFRLTAGFFGDEDRRFGFQMSGFITERRANVQDFGSLQNLSGIPTIARPFIDVAGLQSSLVLSGPNFGPATVRVSTTTQTWGVEPVGVWNIYRAEPGTRANWSLDFLAGYRYLQIKEELTITSRTALDSQIGLPTFVSNPPFGVVTQTGVSLTPAFTNFGGVGVGGPALIDIRDNFRTTNQFNGFVMGLRGEGRYGMITTSAFGKIALGEMHERIEINGISSFFDPTGGSGGTSGNLAVFNSGTGGGRGAAYGGVLANAGNIGTYVHDRFTWIPEVGGTVGIALTRGMTGYMGVNLLYFPDVVRPGTIANPRISSTAVPFSPSFGTPGAPRGPNFKVIEEDQWLGGVNFGLLFRY